MTQEELIATYIDSLKRDVLANCASIRSELVALLVKYVAHVACLDGRWVACSTELSPADMGEQAFTPEEKKFLETEIFPLVK